jgi:hypothetical protein
MFHHVFPENGNGARAVGNEAGAAFLAQEQAVNVRILTGSKDSLEKDPAGQCAIAPAPCI